jgi:hypothetical protein
MPEDVSPENNVVQIEPADPATENVVPFPPISEDEKRRRLMVEIHRLADLATVDWTYQIQYRADEFTKQFGQSPAEMKALVLARLKDIEKAKTESRRIEQRVEKKQKADSKERDRKAEKAKREENRKADKAEREKEKREQKEAEAKAKLKAKEFATIQRLPVADRDGRLQKLAEELLKEDVGEVREQFVEFLDNVAATLASSNWNVEPWPEPVDTAALLQELVDKIHKHVVMAPHQAVALWIMLAWVHDVAAQYSPYLVATSADPGEGKSTLILGVVGRLTPRPFPGGEPSAAIVFRTADEHKPTLLFDNVDTLFQRKPDLTEIFNIGYERGPKVPRTEKINGVWGTRWFDPFCPKACNLIGTNLPKPLPTRVIWIKLKKKMASEVVTKPKDDDEFATLRRKAKRWANDNAVKLKDAPPPPDFINRESDNWNLQLAIAQLASGKWPERGLQAAQLLTRTMHKPSWRELLLAEFQDVFVKRKQITSESFHDLITADPLSIWREYNHGTSAITQRQIAHLLKDTGDGIFPVNITDKRIRGWRYGKDFADAFNRYLPGRVREDPLILSSDRKRKKKLTKQKKRRRK